MGNLDEYRSQEGKVKHVSKPDSHQLIKKESSISRALARYFDAAIERLDYLEYGDPSEYLYKNHGKEVSRSELSSIWVSPKFRQNVENGEEVPIDKLLTDSNNSQLILADPGCGKSTLSRFICCYLIRRFCEGKENYFGLFVPLSLIKLTGRTYQEAVAFSAAKYVGLENDSDVVKELSNSISKSCILFDGFDELPITQKNLVGSETLTLRQEVAKLIRSLIFVQTDTTLEQNPKRLIITCRTKDYYEDKGSNLGSISLFFMTKFTSVQMNLALNKWHNAAKNKLEVSDTSIANTLDERKLGILNAFREYYDLSQVCLTPLMLSALLIVYSDNKDLPSSVSQLCWRAINWFFIDKHRSTREDTFVEEYGLWLLESIILIGWAVHEHFVAGQSKSFDNIELRKLIREANTTEIFKKADYETQEDGITKLASFLRKGHGILVKVSNSEYDFVHNVFREVLAGRALGNLPLVDREKYALNEQWIGPIRYWAGLRASEKDGMFEISSFVGQLSDYVEQKNINAIFASAEMLTEVSSIISPNNLIFDLKKRILKIKEELCLLLKNPNITVGTRVRIGDLLSSLGDIRLSSKLEDQMETIFESDYEIGREDNHKTRIPKYAKCPAAPIIAGHLKEYKIGKYLVTNTDFQLFINDGGYINKKFWKSDIAWEWTKGDQKTIEDLIDKAQNVANIHLTSEIVGERLIPDEIPDRCVQMINRKVPLYWTDPSFNRPNQPVVGINWWEAMAYCNWLEEKLKLSNVIETNKKIRLPTEAEWETAAKLCGSGYQYPWLDGLPSECALVREAFNDESESPIFRSCGVGLFENVKTNLSIYDLVGNVWEWTSSKVSIYNKDSFNQVIDEISIEDRIARGSSWLSSEEESTQITFRSFDPPYNAYEDLGFRIVIF